MLKAEQYVKFTCHNSWCHFPGTALLLAALAAAQPPHVAITAGFGSTANLGYAGLDILGSAEAALALPSAYWRIRPLVILPSTFYARTIATNSRKAGRTGYTFRQDVFLTSQAGEFHFGPGVGFNRLHTDRYEKNAVQPLLRAQWARWFALQPFYEFRSNEIFTLNKARSHHMGYDGYLGGQQGVKINFTYGLVKFRDPFAGAAKGHVFTGHSFDFRVGWYRRVD